MRFLLGILAALLVAAVPAGAAVRKAGDVLPPGQSGFVPASGLSSGTGSPHLTDQVDLFVNFQFKPHTFGQPGTEEQPRPGVKIVRDSYGVPSITGETMSDVWFGAGYAVAQDRLFQLELFRLATTGHLAERVGSSYADDDELVRRDFYEPFELEIQLAKLPPDLRQRFDDYRDGINAWIAETRNDPNKLPGEFLVTAGGPPRDWTVIDSAAIGVYLARTVPSDNGEELNNLRGLRALGSKRFDQLLPLRIPGQVATVPRSSGVFPSMPGRTRREERRAYARSRRFLASVPLPPEPKASSAATSTAAAFRGQLDRRGSNMWAIRSERGRAASIFNGPQLGFQIPELFVEFEVHGPGLDIRGVTAPGVPLVAIGHNGHVAWGFTSGLSDEDDLYVEKLDGAEDRYVHKGETRDMACRDEVIRWSAPPANLLSVTGGEAPDTNSGEKTVRLCRTVHGPVQARAEGVAFARRYAVWGREVETLEGLTALEQARTVHDVDRAMARVTWNENLMAADEQGNIGYWHPGLHPLRPEGWDERLPYPGTGEAEWRGFLPVKRRPFAINPRQGFLFNWNNVPSEGWTTGDGPARERLLGGFHRAALLRRAVQRAFERGGGYDVTAEVDKITGTTAQQRIPATRRLKAARKGAKGAAKTVLDTILAWDGSYHRTDADGRVDPGVAAWDQFGKALFETALGGVPDDQLELLRHGAGSSHQQEFHVQEVFGLRTLDARGYRRAAALAFEELKKEFQTDDPARWRRPRPMYDTGAQGAASFEDIPFFDRGTWQQVVELGP